MKNQTWTARVIGSVTGTGIAGSRVLLLVDYRPEYRHEWADKLYFSQLRLDRATGCMARIERCVVVPEQEREL